MSGEPNKAAESYDELYGVDGDGLGEGEVTCQGELEYRYWLFNPYAPEAPQTRGMKNDTAKDGKVSCSAARESPGLFPGRVQPRRNRLPRVSHCALLGWSRAPREMGKQRKPKAKRVETRRTRRLAPPYKPCLTGSSVSSKTEPLPDQAAASHIAPSLTVPQERRIRK